MLALFTREPTLTVSPTLNLVASPLAISWPETQR